MKKRLLIMVAIVSLVASMLLLCGCESKTVEESSNIAVCSNGRFVGSAEEKTGVLSFKGIPYAKAPVGELRWKAPVAAEDSDEEVNANEFGKSSIQYEWHSEPIQTEISEDCLTLNVWTKDLETKDKPVMVFFHGGSFAWGGTSEELYNGQYIVSQNEDVVVITCNYRIGMMGFIDFSDVEGGEAFADSRELGLLDAIESLRWIKKNAEAFGGNPDNITIFGESAGSTMMTLIMASEDADGLYNRVICESGGPNLTFTEEQFKASEQTAALMEVTGAKNMDDLMALSEEELIKANEYALDEDETCINDLYSLPLRGGVADIDMYGAIARAKERGVDVLIGTNADEISYWVAEMGEIPMTEMDEEGVAENLSVYEEWFVDPMYDTIVETVNKEDKASIDAFLEQYKDLDQVWARTKLITEALFRSASIKAAECHADAAGDGKTYMYYFGKRSDNFDFIGACHASELAYVFHNTKETDFSGTVDPELADKMCKAWANFARTGDPSSDDVQWTTFGTVDRNTMVIGDDCSMQMVSDPQKTDRILTSTLADYYFWSAGA